MANLDIGKRERKKERKKEKILKGTNKYVNK